MLKRLTGAGFAVMLAVLSAQSQTQDGSKCKGPIYDAPRVTRLAKIIEGPDLSLIKQTIEPNARGLVVVHAVLCRTGQVTDIKIVQGLSAAVNQFTTAAVELVRFVPAELKWHSVSQTVRFEIVFGVNEPRIKITSSAAATVRLVESVNVVGQRRLTAQQILSWIQTRPGEPYSPAQTMRDLEAILATGNFDKTQTSITFEDGIRGGVVVTFTVVELPLTPK